jgi:hypothetical protein
VGLVRVYQAAFSSRRLPTCKYYPSCSEYMIDAVRKYGIARGTARGAWRVLRCNPFSRGGYDPA